MGMEKKLTNGERVKIAMSSVHWAFGGTTSISSQLDKGPDGWNAVRGLGSKTPQGQHECV